MTLEETVENDAVILKVEGTITTYQGDEFLNAIIRAATKKDHVILDMSNVQMMSSAGLRGLIVGHKNLSSKGGKLEIIGINDTVRETIRITGLDKLLITELQ